MLTVALVQLGWSTNLTFIPCELSGRITIAFLKVYDAVGRLKWYAFPIEIQKMLPIVLMSSEEPMALRCFGSILCGRDVFKQVCMGIPKIQQSAKYFGDFFFFRWTIPHFHISWYFGNSANKLWTDCSSKRESMNFYLHLLRTFTFYSLFEIFSKHVCCSILFQTHNIVEMNVIKN